MDCKLVMDGEQRAAPDRAPDYISAKPSSLFLRQFHSFLSAKMLEYLLFMRKGWQNRFFTYTLVLLNMIEICTKWLRRSCSDCTHRLSNTKQLLRRISILGTTSVVNTKLLGIFFRLFLICSVCHLFAIICKQRQNIKIWKTG